MNFKTGTVDPYRYSSTIDATSNNFHTLTSDRQPRPNRYEPAKTTRDTTKKWIVEKEHHEKQRHSLSKRLRDMR
jgi:hypothetical protein